MTERKPPGLSFESWVEKQIAEAMDRGEFDNLPGAGKPLPGSGRPDDENWWLNRYLHREGVTGDAMLPEALQVRKEAEELPHRVAALSSEGEVREAVAALNARVRSSWRTSTGPFAPAALVDEDAVVRRWRDVRTTVPAPSRPAETPARTPWWRRLRRRRGIDIT